MNPGLEEKGLKPGTSIVVGAHAADVVTETATKEEKTKSS